MGAGRWQIIDRFKERLQRRDINGWLEIWSRMEFWSSVWEEMSSDLQKTDSWGQFSKYKFSITLSLMTEKQQLRSTNTPCNNKGLGCMQDAWAAFTVSSKLIRVPLCPWDTRRASETSLWGYVSLPLFSFTSYILPEYNLYLGFNRRSNLAAKSEVEQGPHCTSAWQKDAEQESRKAEEAWK